MKAMLSLGPMRTLYIDPSLEYTLVNSIYCPPDDKREFESILDKVYREWVIAWGDETIVNRWTPSLKSFSGLSRCIAPAPKIPSPEVPVHEERPHLLSSLEIVFEDVDGRQWLISEVYDEHMSRRRRVVG